MIDINGTLLIQFLNFFVLVAILAKFAYKPILKTLEDRRNKIASDLNNAQAARDAAEKMKADYQEQIKNAHDVYGMALNLEEDNVGAVLLGNDSLIREGDTVRRTGRVIRVPVGDSMLRC